MKIPLIYQKILDVVREKKYGKDKRCILQTFKGK